MVASVVATSSRCLWLSFVVACSPRAGSDATREPARQRPDAARATPRSAGPQAFIRRAELETQLADREELGRGIHVVPVANTGFRLGTIPPGSLIGRLGFQEGDVVRAVNGQDLATPELALHAWMAQRWASSFLVDVRRRDVDLRLQISVIEQ